MNILVVEDVPIVRERIIGALAELQDVYVVGEADSVETALSTIELTQPDVVLLDISLPSNINITNGIGVLKWVKETYPAMHVIMLTNHAGQAYSDACGHAGAFALLDKSNEFEKLPAVVAALSKPQKHMPAQASALHRHKDDADPAGPSVFQSEGTQVPQRKQPVPLKQDTKFAMLWLSLLVSAWRLVARANRRRAWKGNTWQSN